MNPYKHDGRLNAFWEDRVNALDNIPEHLAHKDHKFRQKRWEAFASPFWLEILIHTARVFFSKPEAQDRLRKHWYLLFLSLAAVVIQAQNYGLGSALSWGFFLVVMFLDMLE
jgi:hypothetical protein